MDRLKSSERRMKLILLLQQSKNRLTVDEIADRFGVSRRTVFRDMNTLSELNVPVVWDKYSGYGIMEGYTMPPIMFNSKELATIMAGLNFVRSQVDKQLVDDANGVEIKIKAALPDELKEFIDSIRNSMIVDPYLHFGTEKKGGGSWYLINSAISQKKKIKFSYQSLKSSGVLERVIDPYLLVFYDDHWNVIGFSEKREDFRNFILERMSNVEILPQNYLPKNNINTEALIFRSDESSNLVELEVGANDLSALKSKIPTKIIKEIEIKPKLFRVSFYFESLDYINEWLLQFGDKIKITEPEELIKKREVLLKKMLSS
jgi:predicted DNA-binding transcriptional regulator YafY